MTHRNTGSSNDTRSVVDFRSARGEAPSMTTSHQSKLDIPHMGETAISAHIQTITGKKAVWAFAPDGVKTFK